MFDKLFRRQSRISNFQAMAASMRAADVVQPEFTKNLVYAQTYAEMMITYRRLAKFFADQPQFDLRHERLASDTLLNFNYRLRDMERKGEISPVVASKIKNNTDAWGRRMGLAEATQMMPMPVKKRWPWLIFLKVPQFSY